MAGEHFEATHLHGYDDLGNWYLKDIIVTEPGAEQRPGDYVFDPMRPRGASTISMQLADVRFPEPDGGDTKFMAASLADAAGEVNAATAPWTIPLEESGITPDALAAAQELLERFETRTQEDPHA